MKNWKSINVLFSVLAVLLFTQCTPDSKDSAEEVADKVEEVVNTPENVQEQVLTPEEIAKQKIAGLPTTTVSWDKSEHDFGDINKNEKVTTSFKFKNTGDAPLIIADAKAGCGCTVPSYPKEPIQPGESGEISVQYNGSGNGKVTKFVNVTLNTEAQSEKLTISTNVLPPAGE